MPALSDDEIMLELTAVKGIGEWSADIFLMFSLGRPDVLAVGDLGITLGDFFQMKARADQKNYASVEGKAAIAQVQVIPVPVV